MRDERPRQLTTDEKVKKEYELRRRVAKEEDLRSGRRRAKDNEAQAGDFRLSRELESSVKDYRKFKDPRDRAKIKEEFFGRQEDYRKGLITKN